MKMENLSVQEIVTQQHALLEDKMEFVRQKGHELVNSARFSYKKWKDGEWQAAYDSFVKETDQIEKIEWCHGIEQLWQAQHEVVFWQGFVEQELQNHDRACTLLEKAIEGIEKHGLQKSMPKVYAMAYICLARSRLEKQSGQGLLREYLKKANIALCGMEEEKDDLKPYTKKMVQVEWNLQKSIVEVGMYQTQTEGQEKKGAGTLADEKTAEQYLLETYRILKEDSVDQNKQNDMDKTVRMEHFYQHWLKRQQLTLYATYGAMNKKSFFQEGKCNNGQSGSSMGAKQFTFFVRAMLYYCCSAIKDDWKNTISTGSMAGLIHYCETNFPLCSNGKTLCGEDEKYPGLKKFLQRYLTEDQAGVLKDILVDIVLDNSDSKETECSETEKVYQNETHDVKTIYSELLKYIYNRFKISSPEKKSSMSGMSLMNQLLAKTLEIDRCNMFALSLQAASLKKSGDPKNDKGAGEVELYPAMRQAALRKHFKEIGGILDEMGEKEALLPFMLDLIDLYNAAVNYMDKASAFTSQSKEEDSEEEVLLVGHYTRLSVIPKLIRADSCGRFRLQNVRYLNDPSEGKVMMRYIEKAWKDKKGQDSSASGSELFQSLIELYRSEEGRDGSSPRRSLRSSIYIGCFSDRLDQLNMWSRYGDEGKGCCLVIDATKSFDRSSRTVLENLSIEEVDNHYHLDQNHYPLYRTIYLPGDAQTATMDEIERYNQQRSRAPEEMHEKKNNQHFDREHTWWKKQEELAKAFKDFVNEATESMKSLETHYNDLLNALLKEENKRERKEQLEELKRELLHTEMVIFDLVRFLVKDDRYRDEREYRVIQYSHEPKVSEIVPNEKGPASGIPRLYVEIEKNISYQYVCLGPLVQNFSAEAAYLANLHRIQNEDGKRTDKRDGIPVQQSMIPYCI